jgi:hypothetical protein
MKPSNAWGELRRNEKEKPDFLRITPPPLRLVILNLNLQIIIIKPLYFLNKLPLCYEHGWAWCPIENFGEDDMTEKNFTTAAEHLIEAGHHFNVAMTPYFERVGVVGRALNNAHIKFCGLIEPVTSANVTRFLGCDAVIAGVKQERTITPP